jgi:hypothetical protein
MEDKTTIYDSMSNAEKEVAEYLKRINIYWLFENPIFLIDEKERPRVWTPDFYLPELGIYIEVCGADRDCYSYREGIYRKNKVPVIFIHQFKDESDWQEYLRKRIAEINKFRADKIMDSLVRI